MLPDKIHYYNTVIFCNEELISILSQDGSVVQSFRLNLNSEDWQKTHTWHRI